MKNDYYKTLGVSKDATQQEIKSAFKKLALKYHPDRNKEPDAEAKFKEINAAYEVLNNPSKRQQYDQFGSTDDNPGFHDFHQDHQGQGGFNFQDFGFDIFEAFNEFGFMGGGRSSKGTQQPQKGKDIEYEIMITLEDAFHGKTTEIEYYKLCQCSTCSGSGVKGVGKSTCSVCNGVGRTRIVKGFSAIERTCYNCKGSGISTDSLCSACKGEGRFNKKVKLSIKIPAGIEEGKKVRVKGEGEAGIRGGAPGDFLLHIRIKPHKNFTVSNKNLHGKIQVDLFKALLGGTMTMIGIDGKEIEVNIPECLQSDARIKISNQGMPALGDLNNRGDLILDCTIQMPKKLNSKQKELIKSSLVVEKSTIFSNLFS